MMVGQGAVFHPLAIEEVEVRFRRHIVKNLPKWGKWRWTPAVLVRWGPRFSCPTARSSGAAGPAKSGAPSPKCNLRRDRNKVEALSGSRWE